MNRAFSGDPKGSFGARTNKPLCVIANTTKGKGVSFMEDVVKWHHGVPSDDEFIRQAESIRSGKQSKPN